MPLYMWTGKKNVVKEIDVNEQTRMVRNAVLTEPPSTTVVKKTPRYRCMLCQKAFIKTGVFSIHFKREHSDHYVDKDSWRQYVLNMEESGAPDSRGTD